jgi:hypothetical protein
VSRLSEERRSQLLGNLARLARRYGLRSPAICFLAAHEPLSFLIGQLLFIFQPTLAPFLGDTELQDYALLFEDKENIRHLANLLTEESVDFVRTGN